MSSETSGSIVSFEGSMPCDPKAIEFYPYILKATFGRAEREEAAARLVSISKDEGEWVGSTFRGIIEQVLEELRKDKLVDEIQARNDQTMIAYRREMRQYVGISILTLGLYAIYCRLVGGKPQLKLEDVPESDTTVSIVRFAGLEGLVQGFLELESDGYVRIQREHDRKDVMYHNDVIFPTPSLATRIIEVQKRDTVVH